MAGHRLCAKSKNKRMNGKYKTGCEEDQQYITSKGQRVVVVVVVVVGPVRPLALIIIT